MSTAGNRRLSVPIFREVYLKLGPMNAAEVDALTCVSFERSTYDFVPSATLDPSEYLAPYRAAFLKARVAPEQGVVVVEPRHAERLGVTAGTLAVWFITRGDPQSVFFGVTVGKFGAAWGPERETGIDYDLGFRSDDPFEMFMA
jgi:hypothetical protein